MAQLFFFAVLALVASASGQQSSPCVFPFVYNGDTYDSCTTDGSTAFWCSFDDVYSGNWKYCDEQECTFPFIYNGQTFLSCAEGGALASDWCSLDAVYDGDYVSCSDNAVIVDPLEDKPEACHFPFEYQGQTYSTCTLEESSDLWCSLDAVYDGNYKYCGEEECVFPFIYNGEEYSECVIADNGRGWCSLDHIDQGNRVYCSEQVCSETVYKDQGHLHSPNYPQNYNHDMDCSWIFPARGGTVNLEFQDFALEGGAATFGMCEFDYVEIFAGDRNLGTWCGDYGPTNITSTNEDVTIHMVTDDSVAARGWNLKFKVVGAAPFGPGLEECGGLLHGQHGERTSPGFPDSYHNDIDCTWTLEAKHGGVILEFPEFSLEKPGEYQGCTYDFVEIHHGLNRVGRFCGDSPPPTTTYYEKVSIRFRTDQHTVASGFRFSWTYLHAETSPVPPMPTTPELPKTTTPERPMESTTYPPEPTQAPTTTYPPEPTQSQP